MCGFAAFFEPGRTFPEPLLAGADRDLFHRGPDAGGRADEPGWALVFRRLSILDVRHEADQPMTSADGRHTLVFNGEIYNYKDLRAELEAAGVTFRTTGDTEVLLEGYRHWGEGVVERLEGMYAFVVVDRPRNLAVAARDPFGIKPLYVRREGKALGLASEMRPLMRMGPVTPDPRALSELLEFSWAAGRLSNVREIEWVEPGTLLTIPLDGGNARERRFLDILDTLTPAPAMDEAEALAQIDQALRRSLHDHLASDVGYTVQLSGGVDSSLLTGLAAKETPGKLASFAVDLGDYEHNERVWRDKIVGDLGLDHHEIPFSGRDFADALPRAVRHMEGPSPHGGCVMLMMLCDHIRKRSKVVITGEGADEMFGGYERYATWPKTARQEQIARLLPRPLLPDAWPFKGVRRLAGMDAAARAAIYRDTAPIRALFPDLSFATGAREAASARFADFRDRLFAVDQTAYLQSLLVRQDKMAMAASVEARVPFVHLPVLKLVNSLPRSLRTPGGVTKPLLKKVAEPLLPHDLLYRRKVGLLLPYGEWLRDEQALGRYLDRLAHGRLAEFAAPGALARAVEGFRKGDPTLAPNMLTLVNLEVWLGSLAEQQAEARTGSL